MVRPALGGETAMPCNNDDEPSPTGSRRRKILAHLLGLRPLRDAPFVVPYEGAEVFATTRVYLREMGMTCLAPSMNC